MRHPGTPSQTVGPFFSIGLDWLNENQIAKPEVSGQRITITGRVLDGDSQPVPDAVLEIWQADSHGKYAHSEDAQEKPLQASFRGFARFPTNDAGEFRFTTIKPGGVPGPSGAPQAPHLLLSLFMRGLLKRLVTRIYFPNEPANSKDFVLNRVEPARRGTLIARKSLQDPAILEWNIVLQGPKETVFFDC